VTPDETENPYAAPQAEFERQPPGNLTPESNTPGARAARLYLRLIGCVQILYALVSSFGCFGVLVLLPGNGGPLWLHERIFSKAILIGLVSLSVSGFFAGCGLVRRRSWARTWEVIYLGASLILLFAFLSAEFLLTATTRRDPFAIIFLFVVITLPFLPVLFLSRWLRVT
jgi:hypothetical protein